MHVWEQRCIMWKQGTAHTATSDQRAQLMFWKFLFHLELSVWATFKKFSVWFSVLIASLKIVPIYLCLLFSGKHKKREETQTNMWKWEYNGVCIKWSGNQA